MGWLMLEKKDDVHLARYLKGKNYRCYIFVRWFGRMKEEEKFLVLVSKIIKYSKKKISEMME